MKDFHNVLDSEVSEVAYVASQNARRAASVKDAVSAEQWAAVAQACSALAETRLAWMNYKAARVWYRPRANREGDAYYEAQLQSKQMKLNEALERAQGE